MTLWQQHSPVTAVCLGMEHYNIIISLTNEYVKAPLELLFAPDAASRFSSVIQEAEESYVLL